MTDSAFSLTLHFTHRNLTLESCFLPVSFSYLAEKKNPLPFHMKDWKLLQVIRPAIGHFAEENFLGTNSRPLWKQAIESSPGYFCNSYLL